MKEYYIHEIGQKEKIGPLDFSDLKKLDLNEETLIWYEGLDNWKKAKEIDELKPLFSSQPPPIPNDSKLEGNRKNRTKDLVVGSVALIAILTIIIVSISAFSGASSDDGSYYEQVLSVEEQELAYPSNFLSASGTYSENFWGDKLLLDCTFTNKATIATYKDAIVRVVFYSKTKTVLGEEDLTVYETFKPNTTKTVELKVKNYKNVDAIGWKVVSALPF